MVEGVLPTNAPSISMSAPGGVESMATDACAGDGGGTGTATVAVTAGAGVTAAGFSFAARISAPCAAQCWTIPLHASSTCLLYTSRCV